MKLLAPGEVASLFTVFIDVLELVRVDQAGLIECKIGVELPNGTVSSISHSFQYSLEGEWQYGMLFNGETLPYGFDCSQYRWEQEWEGKATVAALTDGVSGCRVVVPNSQGIQLGGIQFTVPTHRKDPWKLLLLVGLEGQLKDLQVTYTSNQTMAAYQPGGFQLVLNGAETLYLKKISASALWLPTIMRGVIGVEEVSLDSFQLLPPHKHDAAASFLLLEEVKGGNKTYIWKTPQLNEMKQMCAEVNTSQCSLALGWTSTVILNPGNSGLSTTKLASFTCPPHCAGINIGGAIAAVEQCQGYGFGPECFEAESAHLCAYGAGSDCRPCPSNSICPGGYRAWPVAGYWTPFASYGKAFPCPPPLTSRCQGWDVAQGGQSCAPGYDPSVPLCGACLPSHRQVDGTCEPCDNQGHHEGSVTESLQAIGIVVGGMLFIFVSLALFLTHAFRTSSLPVSKALGYRIAGEVILWMVTTMQVFLQLTRVQSPGLPPFLRRLFSFLQAFESDITALIPYECSGGSPFAYLIPASSIVVMAVICVSILGGCHLKQRRWVQKKAFPVLQLICLFFSIILYGPVLAKSIEVLQCVDASVAVVTPTGIEWKLVQVWSRDTRVRCYEGDHAPAAAMSLAAIFVVGTGLPILVTMFSFKQFTVLSKRRGEHDGKESTLGLQRLSNSVGDFRKKRMTDCGLKNNGVLSLNMGSRGCVHFLCGRFFSSLWSQSYFRLKNFPSHVLRCCPLLYWVYRFSLCYRVYQQTTSGPPGSVTPELWYISAALLWSSSNHC